MNIYLVYAIGFSGQLLFFARMILQWFKSENEGEIISPVVFWKLSLVASQIMMLYGILRSDFAIILGQFMVYFIYVRNLQLKNAWKTMHRMARSMILITPFLVIAWLLTDNRYSPATFFRNEDIPGWLILLGAIGQLVFSFRFVYQWITSEKEKESLLPGKFWIISIAGSLITFIYAILRLDPVLFLSNLAGLFVYIRNLLLFMGKSSIISFVKNDTLQNLSRKIGNRIS